MEILHIQEGAHASHIESIDAVPQTGTIWLNFHRGADVNWAKIVQKMTGIEINERHIRDAENEAHPSFTDSTENYELLIIRSLSPSFAQNDIVTRSTFYLLIGRVLVTVSASDSRSVELTRDRLVRGKGRVLSRPVGIMHMIINYAVDRFLSLREPLTDQLNEYRDALLDPKNPYDDWAALLNFQKKIMTLEGLCESQGDAITSWKDNTDVEIDDHLSVRLIDLLGHIRRVTELSSNQQKEIGSLIQLHFSAVAHRTNEIVKLLTLLSAIFLPLSLIAGIYGMNFDNMPELKSKYGYFVVVGGMVTLAIGLLLYFKNRKWI